MSKLNDQKKVNYILGLKNKHNPSFIREEIRRVFEVKKTRSNEIFNTLFSEQHQQTEFLKGQNNIPTKKAAAFIKTGDNAIAEVCGSPDIKTLDELLKVTNVNLDEWKVEKYIVNKWSTARKSEVKSLEFNKGTISGTVEDDGSMSVTPLYQVKAWLIRKRDVKDKAFLIEELNKHLVEKAQGIKNYPSSPKKQGLLYEIAMPDIHFGKLAWGKETGGADYDSKIAENLVRTAVADLITNVKGQDVERILLPVGNDYFNVDNAAGTTTAGTKQDEDTRWKKSFTMGSKLMVDIIEYLSTYAPVDVIIVQGNHDNERSFYLGEYLLAWFKNHKDVTVNNGESSRKYYRGKKVLLGMTHGNEEKIPELPLIMATERPKDWAECTAYKGFQLGHWHREKLEDIKGVKVNVLPSLCSADSWHAGKGYIGTERLAVGLLFDGEKGLVANYYFKVSE